MGIYILKRLLLIVPTLLLILLCNFAIIQIAPGGPVEQAIENAKHSSLGGGNALSGEVAKAGNAGNNYIGSQGLSDEMLAKIKAQYGFDKPAHERFALMLRQFATGDFGVSFFKDKPVLTLIKERLPVSISLGLWTLLLVYIVAIPLGIAKALRHGSQFDTATSIVLVVGYAVPVVSFAVVLIVLFAGASFWQIFPLQGLVSDNFAELSLGAQIKDYFWHLALPLTVATVGGFASLAFLTKFSFLEEIHKQYVLTAQAKGLSKAKVLYGHVFRNAMLVVIAGLPVAFVGIFFGSNFLIENIFGLDGLGLMGLEAIEQRDYPVIFGTLFISTCIGLVLGIVSDLMYVWVDPRIDFDAVNNRST